MVRVIVIYIASPQGQGSLYDTNPKNALILQGNPDKNSPNTFAIFDPPKMGN